MGKWDLGHRDWEKQTKKMGMGFGTGNWAKNRPGNEIWAKSGLENEIYPPLPSSSGPSCYTGYVKEGEKNCPVVNCGKLVTG